MTFRDSDREAIVDELLLDADAADSTDVRLALLSMGSFANLAAPAPGAELSAMLAGPHDEVSKRRWKHKHRTAVVSVAVVAAMGLGVSGVAAASSGFTRNPTFIDELLGNVRPQPAAAGLALPTPDAPRVTTEPAPVGDPAAIPSAPSAGAVPVPGSAAPTENQAQAAPQEPDVAQAPAPAADQSISDGTAKPASPNPGSATPGSAKPGSATPPNVEPNPVPHSGPNQASPQEQPGSGKDDKQHVAGPDASKRGSGKPAKTVPGAGGSGSADQELQAAKDRWKQWLKRGNN